MAPLEVCRREEGKKGGRDEGREGGGEEGMKGERQEHCEEENVLVACIVVLKEIQLGSLIPRFSPRANENPTASNECWAGPGKETTILPLAIKLCKYMYQTFTTSCM